MFLLAGDKFMTETYLKQPGFTYSAYELFTKNKVRTQKSKEAGDSWYTSQHELDKAKLILQKVILQTLRKKYRILIPYKF